MRKLRIVKRIYPDGSKFYVIQRQGWFFRHRWRDLAGHPFTGPILGYNTIAEALKNLKFFDGSKPTEVMVFAPEEPKKS